MPSRREPRDPATAQRDADAAEQRINDSRGQPPAERRRVIDEVMDSWVERVIKPKK